MKTNLQKSEVKHSFFLCVFIPLHLPAFVPQGLCFSSTYKALVRYRKCLWNIRAEQLPLSMTLCHLWEHNFTITIFSFCEKQNGETGLMLFYLLPYLKGLIKLPYKHTLFGGETIQRGCEESNSSNILKMHRLISTGLLFRSQTYHSNITLKISPILFWIQSWFIIVILIATSQLYYNEHGLHEFLLMHFLLKQKMTRKQKVSLVLKPATVCPLDSFPTLRAECKACSCWKKEAEHSFI